LVKASTGVTSMMGRAGLEVSVAVMLRTMPTKGAPSP